jgi:AhpD family alkylhydroperoxidase
VHDPKTLRRTSESIKEVMAPGALDPKIKEMIYVAVSVAHRRSYCIHSDTASTRAKGMTEAEYREMLACHHRHGRRDQPAGHRFGRAR